MHHWRRRCRGGAAAQPLLFLTQSRASASASAAPLPRRATQPRTCSLSAATALLCSWRHSTCEMEQQQQLLQRGGTPGWVSGTAGGGNCDATDALLPLLLLQMPCGGPDACNCIREAHTHGTQLQTSGLPRACPKAATGTLGCTVGQRWSVQSSTASHDGTYSDATLTWIAMHTTRRGYHAPSWSLGLNGYLPGE